MGIDPLSPGEPTAAAGVAVFNASGSLLLGRHAHDGRWATFGGSVEDGESAEEAARREVREEADLELNGLEMFGTFGGSPIYTVQYADGSSQSYAVTMFGYMTSGDVQPRPDGTEILECRWFTPDALKATILAVDMAEIVPAALDWFRSRGDTRQLQSEPPESLPPARDDRPAGR